MSVLGMSLLDFCWDKHQLIFALTSVPFSYVDNLSLLSDAVTTLVRSFHVMDSFFDMWGMSLDRRKTYCWATRPVDRTALRTLQFQVKLTAMDLGGALAFGRRSAAPLQVQRLQSLEPAWAALRRSVAPLALKEYVIRQAFWPRGLHAICITPSGTSQQLGLKLFAPWVSRKLVLTRVCAFRF